MPKFAAYQPIYNVTEQFVERCLLGNKSLLWEDQIVWTPENVREVKERIVDRPIFGAELSFTEKLKQQMQGASSEQWMLLTDIYYVYYLPSTSMTIQSKRAAIRWAVEQAKAPYPDASQEIWEALSIGFARTGQRYHMKHTQFSLILRLADSLKYQVNSREILSTPQTFRALVDKILEGISDRRDRAWDMRNALLYMIFPEHYEPTLSNTDKRAIVTTYQSLLGKKQFASDDEAIEHVRKALSSSRFAPNELPFSFYEKLKAEWKNKESVSKVNNDPVDDDEDQSIEKSNAIKTIFISYRRDDSIATTGRIYSDLVDEFTAEGVFKDVDSIPPGVNFKTYISEMVSQCQVLLAIIGKRWGTIKNKNGRRLDQPDDFVRLEIASAFEHKILIIPVYVDDAKPVFADTLPVAIQELGWLQGVSIRHDPDFNNDMKKLINYLKAHLNRI